MRLYVAVLACALVIGCSSSHARTASCQQLAECCTGDPQCDPIVDQNDPGACQTQLVVERGEGHCMDSGIAVADVGPDAIACIFPVGTSVVCVEASGSGLPSMCGMGSTMVISCPPQNEVARCTINVSDGGLMAVEVVHYYAPTTASAAQQACVAAGGH
jgi:hypothetical protein